MPSVLNVIMGQPEEGPVHCDLRSAVEQPLAWRGDVHVGTKTIICHPPLRKVQKGVAYILLMVFGNRGEVQYFIQFRSYRVLLGKSRTFMAVQHHTLVSGCWIL